MPKTTELPESIRDFSFRNAATIDSGRNFNTDIERLMRSIDRQMEAKEKRESEAKREDERRQQEAEAKGLEEDAQRRRDEAEAEAKRRAYEEEQRREEEEVEKARQRTLAERCARDEAEAKQRAEQERAFAVAKRGDTVSALDEFLAAYPTSHLIADARSLHATLAARDQAYKAAIVSDDPLVLKAFLERYPEGKLPMQVRKRLQRLEHPKGGLSRRAVLIGGGAVGAGATVAATLIVSRWRRVTTPYVYVPPPSPTNAPTPALDTAQCNNSLCGTSWALTDNKGSKRDIHFLQNGIFYFSDRGSLANTDRYGISWSYSVVGDSVSWIENDSAAEYHGTVRGRYMSGSAKNNFGTTWTWSAVKE
jgi:hypothetical protein